jgi:hypothetical protein
MAKLRVDPHHQVAIDEPDVQAAFTRPSLWVLFLKRAHSANIPRLTDWLNTTGRVVENQFHRRGQRSSRRVDTPLSTSPLDAFINPIRASIQPRANGLRNRERTNRLLMLMQLHANRHDDVPGYTDLIRACLESNQGRPLVARRAVVDVHGVPSLR